MRFWILVLSLTFLWGLSFSTAKIGLRSLEPFSFLWMRSLVSALTVFILILSMRIKFYPPRLAGPGSKPSFWVNIFLHNLVFLLYYNGLVYSTAGRSSLFLYVQPLLYVALATLLAKEETVGIKAILGFISAFVGMVFLFGDNLSSKGGSTWFGDFLVILAALVWAYQSLYLKMNVVGVDAYRITAWTQLFAIIPFVLLAYLFNESLPNMVNFNVITGVGYNGIVGTGLTTILWVWLIKEFPAKRVGAFMFLCPLFGVFLGALILSEPLTLFMITGSLLIALGIYLVNMEST
ncbi:MAG: DMT family transporter [Nitrospinota bacterium]|nr:DMT family transporter [Nitrospinota bacterium]